MREPSQNEEQARRPAEEHLYHITKEVYDDYPHDEDPLFEMNLSKLDANMPVVILNPTPFVDFENDSEQFIKDTLIPHF